MLFIRLCIDKPDALKAREEARADHRAYLQASTLAKLVQAGPLMNDDGSGSNIASFMILEANNLEEAKAFHEGDPFTKAGIFEKSYIHAWDKHFG